MDEYKLDVIDLHFYFMNQIQRRAKDGIHWVFVFQKFFSLLLLSLIQEPKTYTMGKIGRNFTSIEAKHFNDIFSLILSGGFKNATAHRRISNLIFNHIADAWHVPIPNRIVLSQTKQIYQTNQMNRNPMAGNQIPAELVKRINDIEVGKGAVQRTNCDAQENQVQRASLKRKRSDSNFQANNLQPLMQISAESNDIYTSFQ